MAYSPILALVTGVLEVAAGVYALVGPGRKPILRPVAVILFLLAGYQFAEVAVCSNPAALAVRLLVPRPGDILPSAMGHFALILAASFVALVARERQQAEHTASG